MADVAEYSAIFETNFQIGTLLQLPLAIQLPDDETFSSFYQGDNQTLLATLEAQLSCCDGNLIYLWGKQGSGKTHLLNGALSYLAEHNRQGVYIPLQQHASFSVEILEGMESYELVCLDNLEAIAGDTAWENAIFQLFNRIRELRQGGLLIAANASARHLPIQLKDLKSRLDWGVNFQLQDLSDEQKLNGLRLRAAQRGLELTDDAARYLLNHHARDMRSLWLALDRLDEASIIAKRRLTIPFIKQTLNF